MTVSIFGYIFLLAEFLIALSLALYAILNLFSFIKGSPYVASNNDIISAILKEANLTANNKFIELGCGDGRVTRHAVKYYGVLGVGIDINPVLIWLANLRTAQDLKQKTRFYRKNIFDYIYNDADVVYLFLFPKLIARLKDKLISELKPGSLIISHGFKIPGMDNLLYKKIVAPFSTYYYRLPVAIDNSIIRLV